MELRQLRHFVAVVDMGNLSRAAERVAISQPALTRSIKNLEELLGVELLDRKPADAIRKSVAGMLPEGPLGRQQIKKLKVYAGAEHPHAAQSPVVLDLADAKAR
mgnify:CR=1 FL=1